MRQKNFSLYLGFFGWLRFQGGGVVFIDSFCCGLCKVLCAVYLCIILCIFGAGVYIFSVQSLFNGVCSVYVVFLHVLFGIVVFFTVYGILFCMYFVVISGFVLELFLVCQGLHLTCILVLGVDYYSISCIYNFIYRYLSLFRIHIPHLPTYMITYEGVISAFYDSFVVFLLG